MGAPTYAGKLPNKLMPTFQTNLVGNGAVAVAVVFFGNRSYDNSLAELIAILQAGGFRTVCATVCVGQHVWASMRLRKRWQLAAQIRRTLVL